MMPLLTTTDNDSVAIKKAIDVANNRDVILLYLQYGIYNSPVPATFLRCAPSIIAHASDLTTSFPPRALPPYKLEDCLTVIISSEIGQGATGIAHRGTLQPENCDGAKPLDVVIKLAFRSEQRDALRSEYNIYCRLKSKGVHQGIATVVGIFDDKEGCACALVLLYAALFDLRHLPFKISKSALSILESIHGAGILHGDIRRENILTGDLGITIIDFGHSKQHDNQEAQEKELTQLRYCLRSEG